MDQSYDHSPVALQRCGEFVGRTQNWIYDHLRHVPRYRPVILCEELCNRSEFPELEARTYQRDRLSRRVWRRLSGGRIFPVERRWLAQRSPVVLHSHFGYVARGDFDLQERLGVPWLVSFYGADVYELGRLEEWHSIYARMFERVSLVLALGPAMAEALRELGCPKDKIVVHALGVAANEIPYQPRQLESGAVMKLLFAGTFREKKGIEFLIEAVAKAHHSGVNLELHLVGGAGNKVGDDETKQKLFRKIEQLGLDDVVKRYPFLSFERLLALALECHVFVAPSVVAKNGDSEGTPFVLQQMMATGMPVIATVHSDIPFIFGEHESLLVPERDVSALTGRLVNYRDEPDLVRTHGEMLGRRIREDFDAVKCAGRLSKIYDRVA